MVVLVGVGVAVLVRGAGVAVLVMGVGVLVSVLVGVAVLVMGAGRELLGQGVAVIKRGGGEKEGAVRVLGERVLLRSERSGGWRVCWEKGGRGVRCRGGVWRVRVGGRRGWVRGQSGRGGGAWGWGRWGCAGGGCRWRQRGWWVWVSVGWRDGEGGQGSGGRQRWGCWVLPGRCRYQTTLVRLFGVRWVGWVGGWWRWLAGWWRWRVVWLLGVVLRRTLLW